MVSGQNSVAMVGALAGWSRQAEAGAQYIYHLGSLARDRRLSRILDAVADTALLLSETRFLLLKQERMAFSGPDDDRWTYFAVRSGTGYAPVAVVSLKITSFEWRALRAVRDREPSRSVTHAIGDALGCRSVASIDIARSMVELLRERQLIEATAGKGWALSRAGLEALT